MFQHERLARSIGLEQEKIDALKDGPDALVYDDIERKVLRYTDAIVLNVKAGDSTFDALKQVMPFRELTELTLTIGFYMLVSRFLENFEVELENPPVPV